MITYTTAQKQRLVELNCDENIVNETFDSNEEKNNSYRNLEKKLVKENKQKLKDLMEKDHIPLTLAVEDSIERWLTSEEGYTRVATPIIISGDNLKKMNIDNDNHLREQVFWLDNKRCMRPMLAPNLYSVMRDLYRITNKPVKIFEAGSCFRKESQGAQHMNEFTMLNLVELASVEDGKQMDRLIELAKGVMEAVGIENYEIVRESSGVYNETIDVVVDGIELGSGAFGPHPLDANWGIFQTWVGIGFGLERIAMVKGRYQTIKRAGKSVAYIGGIPLKL